MWCSSCDMLGRETIFLWIWSQGRKVRRRRTAGMRFLNSVSRDIIRNCVSLTDCQPDGPNDQCLSTELWSCEQCTVVLPSERLHVLLHNFFCWHSLRLSFAGSISKPGIDFLKHLKRQGLWLSILFRNIINGVDRILISSLGEQISGGFREFENKNAYDGKCEG